MITITTRVLLPVFGDQSIKTRANQNSVVDCCSHFAITHICSCKELLMDGWRCPIDLWPLAVGVRNGGWGHRQGFLLTHLSCLALEAHPSRGADRGAGPRPAPFCFALKFFFLFLEFVKFFTTTVFSLITALHVSALATEPRATTEPCPLFNHGCLYWPRITSGELFLFVHKFT